MKTIIATIAILAAAVGFGDTERQANQSWVLHKIDEIVGTNTIADIAKATNETLKAAKDYTDQHGGGGGGAVQSVNGKTGAVVLDAAAIPYGGVESYGTVTNVEKGLDYAISTADYAMAEATGRPTYDELNVKADRAASGHADEIAALDADGNPKASGKKASDFAPAIEGGYLGMVNSWVYFDEYNNTMLWGRLRFSGTTKEIFNSGQYLVYSDFALVGQEREIAVKEDIASATADLAPKTMIAATDPTFSNAVLAVGLNIDTNSVAVLNEIAATFGGFPIAGTTTTVGGLLAALAAAVAWLKKRAAHLDDDGLADDTFAAGLLSKQVANAKVRYALATASSATMADRTVNLLTMTANETLAFPAATTHDGKTYARDFLLKLAYTAGTMTLPTGVTKVGDELSFTAGKAYLLAFTEIAANQFYVRSIEIA